MSNQFKKIFGDSLKIRHAHLGQSHDLERSIKAHQEAMTFIHKHFPKFSNLPDYLKSLNQEGRFRTHDLKHDK